MRPRIAITAGDPAGIGPEIADKASRDPRVLEVCEPIIYTESSAEPFAIGQVSAAAGRAAYATIARAVEDARAGRVQAIATAPINKLAFSQAGLRWKGHTDLLAHLCGVTRVAMMFHAPELSVVLATVHVPLRDVPQLLTQSAIEDVLALTAESMPRFGIPVPRIAVAGLNPHAGEDGLLGSEEQHVLSPAIAAARARGLNVSGPWPADTVFGRAARGEFDVVLACYHDQGLIPVKLLAFGRAVNVTIGLPIIRTSVDHGTAFDIAGCGVADAGSMVEAVLLAARLAGTRT
ncbi:MAG TPA: 4-hydroxythreonine-4-phosphate dehydrogenase PdxA [Vicinamibacterales bacterium]|nr:4-hydroxythreonine-4-phosphate dehydrogenase PdxA [Vicinamibacterales bacterium]